MLTWLVTPTNMKFALLIEAGMLGSLDANQGDKLIGWDIDEFPSNLYEATAAMYEVVEAGQIGPRGGLNFDSKPRRTSWKPEDLFYSHIVGMDTFAAGLRVAAALKEDGYLDKVLKDRYASWDEGLGKSIEEGKEDFKSIEPTVLDTPQSELRLLRNLTTLNRLRTRSTTL